MVGGSCGVDGIPRSLNGGLVCEPTHVEQPTVRESQDLSGLVKSAHPAENQQTGDLGVIRIRSAELLRDRHIIDDVEKTPRWKTIAIAVLLLSSPIVCGGVS